MTNVMVPLDGSDLAARALPYASHVAKASGGRMTLVRASWAYPVPYVERLEDMPARAQTICEYLADVAAPLRDCGVMVETHAAFGGAPGVIADAARGRGADLIVMTTHGRGGLGRWIYGSVAEEVLRHTATPVLLVSATTDHTWPTDRPLLILLPLDGSAVAEAAIEPTGAFAASVNAEVILLRVVPTIVPPPAELSGVFAPVKVPTADGNERQRALDHAWRYLEDVATRLRATARVREERVVAGSPDSTIAKTALELGVDLVAMATHGRTGLARALMGSVTDATIRRSALPLLLVRPAPLNAEGQSEEVTLTLSRAELATIRRSLEHVADAEPPSPEVQRLLDRVERIESRANSASLPFLV
jgi:nucleotide-binding universal stress UspA family protein